MEKILSISLTLNFTPNTLGCYGLSTYSTKEHSALTRGFLGFFSEKGGHSIAAKTTSANAASASP